MWGPHAGEAHDNPREKKKRRDSNTYVHHSDETVKASGAQRCAPTQVQNPHLKVLLKYSPSWRSWVPCTVPAVDTKPCQSSRQCQSQLVRQPWWYCALRSHSFSSASADVWANSKLRYFYGSSANQSSMEVGLCGFQHNGLCASLLCILSTPPPSPSPLREAAYWRCEVLLSPLAVDTGAQDHSASTAGPSHPDQHGSLSSVCSFFCRGYAHAISYTSLPARISGRLCAESFFPTHPTVLQWDERPFHSIFTEGTPFFPLPGSRPLSPCHP